jgi:hypothetical protein
MMQQRQGGQNIPSRKVPSERRNIRSARESPGGTESGTWRTRSITPAGTAPADLCHTVVCIITQQRTADQERNEQSAAQQIQFVLRAPPWYELVATTDIAYLIATALVVQNSPCLATW